MNMGARLANRRDVVCLPVILSITTKSKSPPKNIDEQELGKKEQAAQEVNCVNDGEQKHQLVGHDYLAAQIIIHSFANTQVKELL